MNMKDVLTVKFFTADRRIPDMECESVRLPVSDNIKGGFSGSYGIRKGHARAIFSLKAGKVALISKESNVFEAEISEGFATVENNEVCIIVNSVK
jgi:F0F1-type ATP synthase epsilon subunit